MFGGCSLLSQYGLQGSNLGNQASGQVPFPAELFFWSLRQDSFCFMCMSILFACMSVPHAHLGPTKVRKGIWIPLDWSYVIFESPGFWLIITLDDNVHGPHNKSPIPYLYRSVKEEGKHYFYFMYVL